MKTIKQTVSFKASPHDVYEAILDPKKHSAFTGDKATNTKKVGGKFTAYGDYIKGTNLELVTDKKIVQRWRGSDWKAGVYSTATFVFAKTTTGTKLTFTQTDVPDDVYADVKQGWIDYYWNPLKAFLEQ